MQWYNLISLELANIIYFTTHLITVYLNICTYNTMFSGNNLFFYVCISLLLCLNLFANCEASFHKNNSYKVRISNRFAASANIVMTLNRKKYITKKKQLITASTNPPEDPKKLSSGNGDGAMVKFEVGKQPNSPDDDVCFAIGWSVEKYPNILIYTFNRGIPGKTYQPDTNCVMTFQGSKNCTPVFGCYGPVNLSKRNSGTKKCATDFLKIEDGLGGSNTFCEDDKVPLLKAARGGRDLFVTFQSGAVQPDAKVNKGFICYVRCDKPGGKTMAATPLSYISPRTLSNVAINSAKKINEDCTCGTTDEIIRNFNKTKKITGRIIGGKNVKMNEFPFLVPIVITGTRQLRCGGSIINNQFVLSAAHCFVIDNADSGESFDVLVHARVLPLNFANGDTPPKEIIRKIPGYELDDVSDEDEATIRYKVVEKIFHPLYTSEELDGDIALLKLDRKIDFFPPDSAKSICVPDHSENSESFNDAKELIDDDTYRDVKVSIAGWGKPFENYSAYSRIPQKLELMPMLNYSTCVKYLPKTDKVTERMICAGFLEGGKDSCQGDSGSPLFVKEFGGYFRQIGINSWGDGSGCAVKESPGVYTDLRPLMQWIYFHTSQTEGVEWCKDPYVKAQNHEVQVKNFFSNGSAENIESHFSQNNTDMKNATIEQTNVTAIIEHTTIIDESDATGIESSTQQTTETEIEIGSTTEEPDSTTAVL